MQRFQRDACDIAASTLASRGLGGRLKR